MEVEWADEAYGPKTQGQGLKSASIDSILDFWNALQKYI
jgi:hypothetical protein